MGILKINDKIFYGHHFYITDKTIIGYNNTRSIINYLSIPLLNNLRVEINGSCQSLKSKKDLKVFGNILFAKIQKDLYIQGVVENLGSLKYIPYHKNILSILEEVEQKRNRYLNDKYNTCLEDTLLFLNDVLPLPKNDIIYIEGSVGEIEIDLKMNTNTPIEVNVNQGIGMLNIGGNGYVRGSIKELEVNKMLYLNNFLY